LGGEKLGKREKPAIIGEVQASVCFPTSNKGMTEVRGKNLMGKNPEGRQHITDFSLFQK